MIHRYATGALRHAMTGDVRVAVARTLIAALRGRRVVIGRAFTVRGLNRITVTPGGRLLLGTAFYGFISRSDRGLLRVRGTFVARGRVKIATGCRIDVLEGGTMTVGNNTYFSPNVLAVVANSLTIGRDCAVAWDVQILDDDRHRILDANGRRANSAPIVIGDGVWIGSGAHIYKGVHIGDGCVVAGSAVVTRSFDEPNCLIGGSPARVLKTNVRWE